MSSMSRNCFSCLQSLENDSYYSMHDQLFCADCYKIQFCRTCKKCGEKIKAKQKYFVWNHVTWHDHCFKCTHCDDSLLENTKTFKKNDRPYCSNCFEQLVSPKCVKCNETVKSGSPLIATKDGTFHSHCFTCTQCKKMVGNQQYYESNNKPYCSNCDAQLFCPKCNVCGQIIQRGIRYSIVDDQKIHPNCLTCFDCGKVIADFKYKKIKDHTYHLNCVDKRKRSCSKPRPNFNRELQNNDIPVEKGLIKREIPVRSSSAANEKSENPVRIISHNQRSNDKTPHMPRRNRFPLINIIRNEENNKTKTCIVCYDDKSVVLFEKSISHQCKHRHRTICNDCVYQHIAKTFEGICTDNVCCPEIDCKITLDYDAIKKILCNANDKKLLRRYEKFYIGHQLEQMSDFIWCAYSCGSGQLADNGTDNNIITCIKCRKKSCFIHRTRWHEGLTCAQYDKQTAADRRANELWLAQMTKNCPKCQSTIEKYTGCDIMKCARCRHEFCWACLADFADIRKNGNHYHNSHCKHFYSYNEQK